MDVHNANFMVVEREKITLPEPYLKDKEMWNSLPETDLEHG